MRKGTRVQLIEIPGLVGRVVTDLYACKPPMVQVAWDWGSVSVLDVRHIERVAFNAARGEWERLV